MPLIPPCVEASPKGGRFRWRASSDVSLKRVPVLDAQRRVQQLAQQRHLERRIGVVERPVEPRLFDQIKHTPAGASRRSTGVTEPIHSALQYA